MSAQIHEIEIRKWSDLARFERQTWMYRGQRSVQWELGSSLERLCDKRKIAYEDRPEVEKELLREFKRAYHHYSMHVPSGGASILEWLSLMQHHGAPTRLCDFTYSIYVATYFAVERAEGACAVWGIAGPWALKEAIRALTKAGRVDGESLGLRVEQDDQPYGFASLLDKPFVRCVVPCNPFRLNERLRIQKGVFAAQGDLTVTFMENLRAVPEWDQLGNLIKLLIPPAMRNEALERLYYMNISRTSLFPGLDGFAQTLDVFHPAMSFRNWL